MTFLYMIPKTDNICFNLATVLPGVEYHFRLVDPVFRQEQIFAFGINGLRFPRINRQTS